MSVRQTLLAVPGKVHIWLGLHKGAKSLCNALVKRHLNMLKCIGVINGLRTRKQVIRCIDLHQVYNIWTLSLNLALRTCDLFVNKPLSRLLTENISHSSFSHLIRNCQLCEIWKIKLFYSSKIKRPRPDDKWIKSLILIQLC